MVIGIKRYVDWFLDWVTTRSVLLPFENPEMDERGPRDKEGKLLRSGLQPIATEVRYGMFGTYEVTFPKEYMDVVLTMLRFNEKVESFTNPSWLQTAKIKTRIEILRKALGCKKIPEYKEDGRLYMPQQVYEFIRIIPIGIREDKQHKFAGTKLVHEGI